jgi:hypothetical protein
MKNLFTVLLFSVVFISFLSAQERPFPFGSITAADLAFKSYAKDPSAAAVVLEEFGEAKIQYRNEIVLVYRYHVKIRILTSAGTHLANVSIPLFKKDGKLATLVEVRASSFGIENGLIKESKLNPKNILTENHDKNWDVKKFAIPNAVAGSVIEYEYETELPSPYFYQNFRSWTFQGEIPKLKSEYWAEIPANWRYNIALRGGHPLKKNESEILDDYFSVPAGKADCIRYKWSMENIPAFYEEEYMTSKNNFLFAINFELLQIEYFDGRKDKVTKEWKDAEHELKTWEKFGVQLKRGGDVVDTRVSELVASEPDRLKKAKKIFEFIRGWYEWNGKFGYYTETGIRKAFESHKGNVGDINLSLIAALRYADLDAEPMLLSTRENGLPTEIFPVLSDFNYVVAKLNIDDKIYLLDATDDSHPFGMLPLRCLNGKGRVLGEKESYWHEIKPAERSKTISLTEMKVDSVGNVVAQVRLTYLGYTNARKRNEINSYSSVDDYLREERKIEGWEIDSVSFQNLADIEKPLVEVLTLRSELDLKNSKSVFWNPFVVEYWKRNPFRSPERTYPVDFGFAMEEANVITITLPRSLRPSSLPEELRVGLPDNGGRVLYKAQLAGDKLTMNFALSLNRPVFAATEYLALKELFNRIVNLQTGGIVLEKTRL